MPKSKSSLLDKWRKVAKHLDFYYYEQVGNRYVFRITPFALIFLIIATIIAFGIVIYMQQSEPSPSETNINVTAPQVSPYPSNRNLIQQAAPPSLPRATRQPMNNMSPLPSTPTPSSNANEQLTPKQTPQLPTSKSPP